SVLASWLETSRADARSRRASATNQPAWNVAAGTGNAAARPAEAKAEADCAKPADDGIGSDQVLGRLPKIFRRIESGARREIRDDARLCPKLGFDVQRRCFDLHAALAGSG